MRAVYGAIAIVLLSLGVVSQGTAATVQSSCVEDAGISLTCTTTTTYQLAGTAIASDAAGTILSLPPLTISGDLTLTSWTFQDYTTAAYVTGNDTVLNVNEPFLLGTSYTMTQLDSLDQTDPANPVASTFYVEQLVDNPLMLAILGDTLWDIAANGDQALVRTLDADGDGISGVRYVGNDGSIITMNYQLSAVPLPAAFWLFASGLLGLVSFLKRRGSRSVGGALRR